MRTRSARIRVLVVDRSSTVRRLLAAAIERQPDMDIVGTAADPILAREMIRNSDPDILTLDVEMVRMDGLDFLERLMRLRPMPVVMGSTLTTPGAPVAVQALRLGAAAVVGRPPAERPDALWDFVDEMTSTIRRVMSRRDPQRPSAAQVRCDLDEGRDVHGPGPIIAIGASTGGPEAISVVLEQMPVDCPGIVISQHMPERFMRAFAARLDRRSSIRVKEADEGEPVRRGHAYLAPGDRHLLVHRHGGRDVIGLSTAPAVNHHRPSVDVMFHALAASAPERVVGLLLTGMGRDGAAGLLALKRGGATTLVQDETSCVVYGMPKAAVAIGGVDEICPLAELAGRALSAASTHRLRRGRGSKIRSA